MPMIHGFACSTQQRREAAGHAVPPGSACCKCKHHGQVRLAEWRCQQGGSGWHRRTWEARKKLQVGRARRAVGASVPLAAKK